MESLLLSFFPTPEVKAQNASGQSPKCSQHAVEVRAKDAPAESQHVQEGSNNHQGQHAAHRALRQVQRRYMKSTHMLERLNDKIKRRTHVVRIFPWDTTPITQETLD